MIKKKKSAPSQTIWMTVYSDLITNNALFFIMLFASVLIAYQKDMTEQEFRDYMRGISTAIHKKEAAARTMTETGNRLARIEGIASVKLGEKDLRIVLPEPVLFESGRARLKDMGKRVLTEVGQVLAPTRYDLEIEGHTDDVPITQEAPAGMLRWQLAMARSTGLGPYYSNRELSAARALQVLQYFTREDLLEPERLAAAAYGEFMPAVPNDSDENRARNRRIEIKLILRDRQALIRAAARTAQAAPAGAGQGAR
ncbi:MAG: flagellar motor protein MotB [Elusimicrobiales bacterium]|nr:flagellar motor protein MotB [Elusimicrobiales bacterium]